jgi:hypothetical protein
MAFSHPLNRWVRLISCCFDVFNSIRKWLVMSLQCDHILNLLWLRLQDRFIFFDCLAQALCLTWSIRRDQIFNQESNCDWLFRVLLFAPEAARERTPGHTQKQNLHGFRWTFLDLEVWHCQCSSTALPLTGEAHRR